MKQFNKDPVDYLIYHNFHRLHLGIDMKSPIQYLQSIYQDKVQYVVDRETGLTDLR
jgi:hypothetical protein